MEAMEGMPMAGGMELLAPAGGMELLAPAGGMEQLIYALHFGADAVYVGGEQFGLRVRAQNFSDVELARAIELAHAAGRRLYVAVNALIHDADIAEMRDYIGLLGELNPDGVILADLATLQTVREVAPNLEIHISTQTSCANWMAARMWHELGAKRVVLARELSLLEIADIRDHIPDDLELEVFVHGAMCMAYSGRCLISDYLVGRDANRGNCAQPCRWRYKLKGADADVVNMPDHALSGELEEDKTPGVFYPVEEDERGSFVLSSQDLMMLEHIDELRDAGVSSLKIEGRVKGGYYVATVVNAYRQVLDGASPADFLPELDHVSHRPYSTGFFFGRATQMTSGKEYSQDRELAATVVACEKIDAPRDGAGDAAQGDVSTDGASSFRITVAQRTRFEAGDVLEVLSPGHPVREVIVSDLRTPEGQLTQIANQTCELYSFQTSLELAPDDILRKRVG